MRVPTYDIIAHRSKRCAARSITRTLNPKRSRPRVDRNRYVPRSAYHRRETSASDTPRQCGVPVNVVFWQTFIAPDFLSAGYVTTTLHWLFVVLQLTAAANAGVNTSKAP